MTKLSILIKQKCVHVCEYRSMFVKIELNILTIRRNLWQI